MFRDGVWWSAMEHKFESKRSERDGGRERKNKKIIKKEYLNEVVKKYNI